MIVQNRKVRGGIAAVINGYRNSQLEEDFNVLYVETYKDGNKVIKLLKSLLGYIHFFKVLLVNKPDLVHVHSSFGPSFYRKMPIIRLAKLFKIPIINHIHGADFDSFYVNASSKKQRIIKKYYNMCTVLIALSKEWEENLKKVVPSEKIHVVENYSFINEEAVKSRTRNNGERRVLFLGEIGRRKGCYDIPYIIKKVIDKLPNTRFVLGGVGEIDEIKTLLKKLNVLENVEFPGWVRGEVKDQLLQSSDLFFLPSYNEGMPMAILDAMGYGLPIVSTNVGGIPKIVISGKNGMIENPGNIEGLANGIIEILQDTTKIKSFGDESYKIVKEKYSLESHIQSIKNLYLSH
ncbi:glycosyltransferase family 4 protein [Actinomycetes bacterium NPDC127524]